MTAFIGATSELVGMPVFFFTTSDDCPRLRILRLREKPEDAFRRLRGRMGYPALGWLRGDLRLVLKTRPSPC